MIYCENDVALKLEKNTHEKKILSVVVSCILNSIHIITTVKQVITVNGQNVKLCSTLMLFLISL